MKICSKRAAETAKMIETTNKAVSSAKQDTRRYRHEINEMYETIQRQTDNSTKENDTIECRDDHCALLLKNNRLS